MIVVDTTVLVYAAGTEHPYREPCRDLVAAVRDGILQATTTVEVVQEFTRVRAGRRGRDAAAGLALDAAATALVSADKAFGEVRGLRHVVPGPGLVAALNEE